MWQIYYTPTSMETALQILAQYREQARVVAGGTDLLIELERQVRTPRVLVDITRIAGLDQIRLEDGTVHLGPLVTHNQVAGSSLCIDRVYPLARACWEVGAPQIRNRGTVAGNLITGSPANDTIPPLWALGARVTLRSTRGQRTLALPEFFKGVRKTALEPDEILSDISIPIQPAERGTFIKLALRRTQAISVANVAVVLGLADGRVTNPRITLGSVAPTIVRATQAEDYLAGRPLADDVIARAGELAVSAARPIDDIRGTADYRREMVRVITQRALRQLRDGAERNGYPSRPVMLQSPTSTPRTLTSETLVHEEEGEQPIVTTVNGKRREVRGANDKTLLRMLREDIGLTGTKEGCAEGECGACTVFMDGAAVMACLVPAPRAHGSDIVTVEGLAQDGRLHPVQQAFVQEGAVQCGYCTPGFLMAGVKLLQELASPSRWEIEQAISGNLCRCTGYYAIVRAIEKAAQIHTAG